MPPPAVSGFSSYDISAIVKVHDGSPYQTIRLNRVPDFHPINYSREMYLSQLTYNYTILFIFLP